MAAVFLFYTRVPLFRFPQWNVTTVPETPYKKEVKRLKIT